MYISTDNYAAWSVKGLTNSGTASLSYAPLQSTYKDYKFTVKITSQSTADIYLTVDGTDYRAYNQTLAGTAGANINAFSIFGSDMWDGDSNDNAYWKQTNSVVDSGSVQLGYYMTSGTYTAGLITDGLEANSTSTARANLVEIGGDAGSAVILNQVNTYTGGTTVNANATALVANNSALGSSGTATVTSGGRIQMSNGITIGRALVLNGDGISGSGSLQNVSGTNTWSGNITNNSNARINANTNTALILSGNISNAASQSLYLGGDGNITNTGTITGTLATGNGAVFKDGAGTLTLSANNNGLTGLFRMRQGTVSITNANSLGSGVLEFGNSDTTNARITLLINSNTTITNRFEIANNSAGGTIDVASGQTATFTGTLSQTNGTANTTKFAKGGAGILVLGGSGSTYNGQLQIGNGTVIIGQSGSFGTNTTTAQRGIDLGLDITDTNQANNVSLLTSNNVTISNSIYVGANTNDAFTRTIGITGGGTNTFSNEFFLGGDLTVNAGSNATDQVTISGALVNTGGLIKTGSGTVVLSGANTYSGTTTISAGTVRVGNGGSTGQLGTGNITNNSALVFDRTGSFSVTNIISGSGTLNKTNTGTLTLGGASANTYSGVTTVNAGILTLAKNAGVNAIAGNVTIGDSSGSDELGLGASDQIADTSVITLNGTAANQRGVFRLYGYNETIGGLSGDGLVEFGGSGSGVSTLTLNVTGNYTNNAVIRNNSGGTGTIALVKSGSGTQVLTGANTYTSGTLVSSGVLEGIGGSSLQGNITNNATVNFNQTTTNTYSGNMSGTGVLNKLGTGTVTLTGTNSHSGGTTLSAGTLNLNSANALGTGAFTLSNGVTFANTSGSAITNANNNTMTLNGTNTFSSGTLNMGTGAVTLGSTTKFIVNGDLTLGGNFSGSLNFSKDGSGTLRLSGSNALTSYTVVDLGTLELAHVDALRNANLYVYGTSASKQVTFGLAGTNSYNIEQIGAGAGGSLAIGGNTLRVGANGSNSTFSGSISGTGGNVTKVGSGSLTLSGTNTHSGGTTLNGGTLNLNHANALGTGTLTLANGTTFANSSGSAITNANNNAMTLNGTNTFSSGTLNMGTGAVTLGSATRLLVNSGGDLTLGGNVSGSAAFNKDGSGTLRLSGSNAFTSYTVVDLGTLELAHVDALRNAELYVYGTATNKQVTFGLAGNNTYNLS